MARKLNVVFVLGSPNFVNKTCLCLKGQQIWATCLALQGKRLGVLGKNSLRWKYVCHAEVGGVTSGGFWVGSNFGPVNWTPMLDPNFRSLSNVLLPVEGGLPLVKPPQDVN